MKRISPNLLREMTRRMKESWRRETVLSQCPTCDVWMREEGYAGDLNRFGPRRIYRQPDQPLYNMVDLARNRGQRDRKLEAQQLRNI